jgi:toxin ParE1/3/4
LAHALIWSSRARDDLIAILSYIRASGSGYALVVADRVLGRAEALADNPRQGRRVPEYVGTRKYREVFVHRWRLIYELTDDALIVTAIVHGARRMDDHGLPDR